MTPVTPNFVERIKRVVETVRAQRVAKIGYFFGLHITIVEEGRKEGLFPDKEVTFTNGMSRAITAMSDPEVKLDYMSELNY